eukprot:CAMPEP_0179933708 /NCGR_PEP_ID=MMETSP0983-20121128/12023_1 /TAXON_ID=483367 /ORGANISM="non described non described, Strain CCMP 2436" /LENGTH=149 /DNA_ID=CAMNT_0021838553 /DNA_START=45 /DNA_END=491 /DNA_ORIENTATION=-
MLGRYRGSRAIRNRHVRKLSLVWQRGRAQDQPGPAGDRGPDGLRHRAQPHRAPFCGTRTTRLVFACPTSRRMRSHAVKLTCHMAQCAPSAGPSVRPPMEGVGRLFEGNPARSRTGGLVLPRLSSNVLAQVHNVQLFSTRMASLAHFDGH